MDVFDLRHQLVEDYSSYISSFIRIRDDRLQAYVQESLANGLLWPDPLIQLNPSFEPGAWIDELVTENTLHSELRSTFSYCNEMCFEAVPSIRKILWWSMRIIFNIGHSAISL